MLITINCKTGTVSILKLKISSHGFVVLEFHLACKCHSIIKTIISFSLPRAKYGMVNQIYPPELQLNKANTSDTEAPFLDLHLSISNGFVSSKFMINVMTLIFI